MRVVYERCCGLDVHKKTVVACVMTPEGQETRTFGTMTQELIALADWLEQWGITQVAMESTGVYWKPLFNLLEGTFEVLMVNAHHIKAVPGCKTDLRGAEWIADLLRHGLVRGSYIPDRPQRELRELVRYRRSLIGNRSQIVNRIQKVLEGANIKLAAVASNVVGVSGRGMLEAMVGGTEDPRVLAALAKGEAAGQAAGLERALQGLMGPHQQLLLASHLRHLDFLEVEIAQLNQEVAARLEPCQEALERLDEIPGVGRRCAQDILAEVGTDMSRFPTAGHLASWAKVCPGIHESAGKRKSTSTGHGNKWLRATLTEAAQAAGRTRGTYLWAQYHRLAARRGKNRATMAVAHTILTTIYYMLRRGTRYQDLGPNYFDERDRQAAVRRTVHRLERLGYRVTLEAA
jgi:transposase